MFIFLQYLCSLIVELNHELLSLKFVASLLHACYALVAMVVGTGTAVILTCFLKLDSESASDGSAPHGPRPAVFITIIIVIIIFFCRLVIASFVWLGGVRHQGRKRLCVNMCREPKCFKISRFQACML